ncbi:MAG TPA: TetR/AcrR family transcriptional regulator [Streptomyces sp.]|uniref:TetR/AcrR family transcriptional regulator n=1 Tax=Streptomyces sp. TaxID=1931 RepID=UPI002D456540|nr:TetR/AcrR family transcriptional regulator [Streptomyces sp.]HZG04516.1 TetR/AcrR family transcriptional regulator [Streptomyces sp.]
MPQQEPVTAPRRTRLRAADRRASILDAATLVFSGAGYRGARTSEIAARVGVSEPVVFQNFGSKAALYAAVLDRAAERVCAGLRENLASCCGGSVAALLDHVLAPGHVDRMHARGTLGALLADAAALTGEPAIAEAYRRGTRRIAEELTAVLAEGQRAGEVAPEADPATGAWWLLSLLASHRFRHTAVPGEARAELEDGLAELTRRLLVPDGPGRQHVHHRHARPGDPANPPDGI